MVDWDAFLLCFQRQIEATVFITKRQMQHTTARFGVAERDLSPGRTTSVPNKDHDDSRFYRPESSDPALSRNINLLPPQRPFTGLDHRIPLPAVGAAICNLMVSPGR